MSKSVLHTPLCDMLGVEVPILSAGMAIAADVALTAAVSEAGGFGVLGCTLDKPKQITEKIAAVRDLTRKPFGVDVILPPKVSRDTISGVELMGHIPQEYKDYIVKLRERFKIEEKSTDEDLDFYIMGTGAADQVDAILDGKVAAFVSGLGSPAFMLDRARAQGMKVLSVVGNVRAARKVLADKVDAVIAQGSEGGGHTGQVGTFALLPQIVEVAGDTPVLASGGVGDGSALAAALAFGCQGVWMGTRFLASNEANISQWKKEALVKATEESTVRTRCITGKPARMIKNDWIETWEKGPLEPLGMPFQNFLVTPVMNDAGDMQNVVPNAAGQIAGLIHEIKPAGEIVREMAEKAAEIIERMQGFLKSGVGV